jgi:hypothetical protein
MRTRTHLLITLSCILTFASQTDPSRAQTSVAPGGVAAGGGFSASSGASLYGMVGGGLAGVSASASYELTAGIPGSVPTAGLDITVDPVSVTPTAGSAVTITAHLQGDPGATLQLFYRLGGETDWSHPPVAMSSSDGETYRGDVPANQMGARGIEYYVVATLNNISVTRPVDGMQHPFVAQARLVDHALPVIPNAQFVLLGFPFDVSPSTIASVFEDDLGAADPKQWKLGRWDQSLNGGAGGYREYADAGNIARGRGYWVIARGGKTVDASGLSAQSDAEVGGMRYATLTLGPGWNQIATPFAFPIAWDDRIEEIPAQIADALFDYRGLDGYQLASVMEPYRGYWVQNTSATPLQIQLPYAQAATSKAHRAADTISTTASPDRWQVQLELRAGGLTDRLARMGVRPEASASYDPLDFGRPPAPEGPALSVVSLTSESPPLTELAGDFRPPGTPGETFPLVVRGNVEGLATLGLAPETALPGGFVVALIDVPGRQAYEIESGTPLTLPRTLHEGGDRYDLLVGDRDWVEATAGPLAAGLPPRMALLPNYPNPFNPETSIVFELPRPGFVRLDIHDVAGRKLLTLVQGDMPAGRHVQKWDGRDQAGHPVASGTYFIRLQAAGTVDQRKLVLLK